MSTTIQKKIASNGEKKLSEAWVTELLGWYGINQRKLPWRETPSPYRVWVSEIMLQQTRVYTVTPYFEGFMKRFPTLAKLAEADQQEVLKAWEGLGYYSRARNLHQAAKLVMTEYDGQIPQRAEKLQELPGIGPYTAAAIASIAHGEPIPVVDGNVLRVFTRFWMIPDDIAKAGTKDELRQRLLPFVSTVNPSDFNQAIMEIGALICHPKQPDCKSCPLINYCQAHQAGRESDFPVKSKRKKIPHYNIAVGVIWKKGRILIGKRRQDQMLGGLWEFPGGKQEPGESIEETAIREIKEETGLQVRICDAFPPVRQTYSHFRITLHAFSCCIDGGRLRANGPELLRWVQPEELAELPFPKANLKLIEEVLKTAAVSK